MKKGRRILRKKRRREKRKKTNEEMRRRRRKKKKKEEKKKGENKKEKKKMKWSIKSDNNKQFLSVIILSCVCISCNHFFYTNLHCKLELFLHLIKYEQCFE